MFKGKLQSILSRKRTIYSVIFKVINIGGQLLIIPLVYGQLGEYEFGIFATINTIAIFALNIDFGIINAIKNPLHEQLQKENDKQAGIIASTSFYFVCFISLMAVLFATMGYAFGLDKMVFNTTKYNSVRDVIYISIVYFFIRFNFQIVHGFNHSIGKYYINDFLLMLGTVLSTLALFIAAKLGVLNLSTVVHCYFAFYCFVYIVYFIIFKITNADLKLRFSYFNLAYLFELLRNSSAFFFLQVTWIGMTNFVPLMLMKEVGPSVAGNYNIISRLFNFLYVINIIILNNFWSEIHANYIKGETSKVYSLYNKLLKISLIFSLICLLMSFFYEPILTIWIRKNVQISSDLVINTFIYYVFIITLSTINIFMNSINKLRLQLMLSATNIVLIAVNYFLLKDVLLLTKVNSIFLAPVSVIFINIVVTFYWVKVKIFTERNSAKPVVLNLQE